MVDVVIALILGFFTVLTAYMGVHVTLHPAESNREKVAYKIGFVGCGIVLCTLVGVQAYRNSQSQAALEAQIKRIEANTLIPPKVQVSNTVPVPSVIIKNQSAVYKTQGDSDKERLELSTLSKTQIQGVVAEFAHKMRTFESQTQSKMSADADALVKAEPSEHEKRDYADSSSVYNETFLPEALALRSELWRRLVRVPGANVQPSASLAAFSAQPAVLPDNVPDLFEKHPLTDGANYLEELAKELDTKHASRGSR
jgi:hypothetical protein